MNNHSLRLPVIALAAGVALSMMFVPPARAADCANPQGIGVERACAKAAESATELRRFVERTQAIYHLSFHEIRTANANAALSFETLGDEYAGMPAIAGK
jgi:hypothetical protein